MFGILAFTVIATLVATAESGRTMVVALVMVVTWLGVGIVIGAFVHFASFFVAFASSSSSAAMLPSLTSDQV